MDHDKDRSLLWHCKPCEPVMASEMVKAMSMDAWKAERHKMISCPPSSYEYTTLVLLGMEGFEGSLQLDS